MRVARASGLDFALLSPAAMAAEIEGELMGPSADGSANPHQMWPLVNNGLDALTFQIARHTCNNVLSIDIAAE